MPLSSSTYGINIHAAPAAYSRGHNHFHKSVKLLHLEKETYDLLDDGDNIFYCKGMNLDGSSSVEYFHVRKS